MKFSVKEKAPAWCSNAIPSAQGWRDPKTNELLVAVKLDLTKVGSDVDSDQEPAKEKEKETTTEQEVEVEVKTESEVETETETEQEVEVETEEAVEQTPKKTSGRKKKGQ